MKTHGGSGCIDVCYSRSGHYLEVSGQLHAPAALLPLDRGLGGTQSRSECCGEVTILTLSGLEYGLSIISGTGAANFTAVVIARCSVR
jgi:hypothetical protein